MQGANLAPSILDGKPGPDSAFFQIFGPYHGDGTPGGWRGVRTESHMYARFHDRPWVLYDLDKDPYQMSNLTTGPRARGLRDRMEKRLAQWMETTGDDWAFNWSHPVEDDGRLYKHRTFHSVAEYLAWAK
ncbi:MAG TPA: hypothetical protein DEH78_28845 [Solibacterales bacterium]|nr:hypothetical protein [Bryobacterales bacterium]